jgi:hypothetical protein
MQTALRNQEILFLQSAIEILRFAQDFGARALTSPTPRKRLNFRNLQFDFYNRF